MRKLNLNEIYKPKLGDISKDLLCHRARLNTGTRCQANCYFCYYKDQLDVDHLDLNIIKKEADLLFDSGITQIELSGGESTIHKDFFEILDYVSKFEHVSMLSNGIKTADDDFILKCYKHGLREILFSLHGSNKEKHNKILGVNSFDKICKSIENANVLGMTVRINCVVDENFNNPEEYTKLLSRFYIKQVNFLPLNYWDDAKNLKTFDYNLKNVQKFIDLNHNEMDINVRYVPLCYMKGYEEYCVSTLDHIYDLTDWNIQCFNIKEVQEINHENMLNAALKNRLNTYTKPIECKDCEFILRCDGYEKR